MKIAISGKGGVGKTTIIALLATHLKNYYQQVLVIDADPSPHMAQTLGIENPDQVQALADMKDLLKERSGRVEGSPFYNINPKIDDLPKRFMLEKDGLRLMILGAIQTGDKGCACAENTVLRRLLTKLLIEKNQVVLLDMEAGVEHLGRGTIVGVDHLLIVVIPSKSSIRTALKIKKLATDVKIPNISFVGNNIVDEEDQNFIEKNLGHKLITYFPNSNSIKSAERQEQPITGLQSEFNEPLEMIYSMLTGR